MAILQMTDLFPSLILTGNTQSIPNGTDMANLVNSMFSYNSAVTAAAGTIAQAVQLTAFMNTIVASTNATAAVALPVALPPRRCFIVNQSTNAIQVYGTANPSNGSVVDAIVAHNATTSAATATGVSQSTTVVAEYLCFQLGLWKQMLTA